MSRPNALKEAHESFRSLNSLNANVVCNDNQIRCLLLEELGLAETKSTWCGQMMRASTSVHKAELDDERKNESCEQHHL